MLISILQKCLLTNNIILKVQFFPDSTKRPANDILFPLSKTKNKLFKLFINVSSQIGDLLFDIGIIHQFDTVCHSIIALKPFILLYYLNLKLFSLNNYSSCVAHVQSNFCLDIQSEQDKRLNFPLERKINEGVELSYRN